MNVGTYLNRKSGNPVKVVETDPKTKTLIYEGADGKTHATTWVSFRKSYKAAEESAVETEQEPIVDNQQTESNQTEADAPVEKKQKKSEKTKKDKDPNRAKRSKEKLPVHQTVIDALDKYKVAHAVVGKRIKLLSAEDKSEAIIIAASNQARLYIRPDVLMYSKLENVLEFTANRNSKSRYSKTALIEFNDIEKIVKEIK